MGEPLSIASSAISIVSTGIQICQGLVWYLDLQVDRKEDISQCKASASDLAEILKVLSQHISQELFPESEVKIIEHNIAACGTWIKKLKEKLEKYDVPTTDGALATAPLLARRAIYPFKKATMDKLNLYVSDARSSLSLALEIMHLYV
jgi:hypothetical protein